MGFDLDISVPVIVVFLQGLLSFFSPCVLPLIPLYISYLSGGAKKQEEDGSISYKRGKVMLHTICFVVGVSFAFFVLGLGVSTLFSIRTVWSRRNIRKRKTITNESKCNCYVTSSSIYYGLYL